MDNLRFMEVPEQGRAQAQKQHRAKCLRHPASARAHFIRSPLHFTPRRRISSQSAGAFGRRRAPSLPDARTRLRAVV